MRYVFYLYELSIFVYIKIFELESKYFANISFNLSLISKQLESELFTYNMTMTDEYWYEWHVLCYTCNL